MTRDEYFELPAGEQKHFYGCEECGEMVDKRQLDQVLFHEDHKPRPDIPYSGSKQMRKGQNMKKTLIEFGCVVAASLALMAVAIGVAHDHRVATGLSPAAKASQAAWNQGYNTGFSLGKESALAGNAAPKDFALRGAARINAQKAGVAVLDRGQYEDAYAAGFEAGFRQFSKPGF